MYEKNLGRKENLFILLAAMMIILALGSDMASAVSFPRPSAPDSSVNITSYAPGPEPGLELNISGGSISVINFNATTVNPKWKGFVGNISGKLALEDSTSMSLFEWPMTSIEGEIYATRSSSLLNWDNISCVKPYKLFLEQYELNFTNSNVDSINNTFNETSHQSLYVGTTLLSDNSCRSTKMLVNGEKTSDFVEVVLQDSDSVIYAALLEDSQTGFNNATYDFQMIVPDWGIINSNPSVPYYFYLELS